MPQPSSLAAFRRPRRALLTLGAALLAGTAVQAQAQPAWPMKPVTIVVAFSPGGPNDVMARIFAEAGLPEFQMVHWVGLSAPAKTPAPVLDKLQAEVARAMAADDVKARFAEFGAEPAVGTRQQFDDFVKAEVGRWTRVIREARIQPE